MTITEPIAERTIFAIDRDSREFEMRLAIGKPYECGPGEWSCPVALHGLHGTFPDMHGVDSWQALMVARQLLMNLLTYFVEDGGKLFWEKGGDELTVDELFGNRLEQPVLVGRPTPEQLRRVERLTPEELQKIDDAILSHATTQWRKVARVVGSAMVDNADSFKNVSDIFYAERLRRLVDGGLLEAQGNLDSMRFSEVRLRS